VSLDQAWREGLGQLGQALTRLLADFSEVHACWDEWEHTHQVALRAARQAGDRHAEASLLRGLGDLRRCQDRLPEAVAHFTRRPTLGSVRTPPPRADPPKPTDRTTMHAAIWANPPPCSSGSATGAGHRAPAVSLLASGKARRLLRHASRDACPG